MADSEGESAGTLVAGDVPVGAPAGRESQADTRVRRPRLRCQAREHRAGGPDRRGENRTCLRTSTEGFAEWIPLPVHSRAGSVRRDVCFAGGSFDAPVVEPFGSVGSFFGCRLRAFNS